MFFLPEAGVNRMFVEGRSPSTHIRSRFPLHPSLSAVDGASIEGKGESISDDELKMASTLNRLGRASDACAICGSLLQYESANAEDLIRNQ